MAAPLLDGLYRAPQVQNPLATQVQQLAALYPGAHSNFLQPFQPNDPMQALQGFHPAYTPTSPVDKGYNPAVYRRATGDTGQAYNDWMAHHPYAVSHGQLPGWVRQYQTHQLQGAADQANAAPDASQAAIHGFGPGGAVTTQPVNPIHERLSEAINHYRQSNGLQPHHPEEIHARVSRLANELMQGRDARAKRALNRIRRPNPVQAIENAFAPPAPAPTPGPGLPMS